VRRAGLRRRLRGAGRHPGRQGMRASARLLLQRGCTDAGRRSPITPEWGCRGREGRGNPSPKRGARRAAPAAQGRCAQCTSAEEGRMWRGGGFTAGMLLSGRGVGSLEPAREPAPCRPWSLASRRFSSTLPGRLPCLNRLRAGRQISECSARARGGRAGGRGAPLQLVEPVLEPILDHLLAAALGRLRHGSAGHCWRSRSGAGRAGRRVKRRDQRAGGSRGVGL
jgi:hypothetical protein